MPKLLVLFIFTLVTAFTAVPAQASFSTGLQALLVQGTALRSSLAAINVSQGNTCTQLGTLNTLIESYLVSIQGVYNQIAAPLYLTADDLTALNELSGIAKDLATDSVRLSLEVRSLELVANLFEYRAALSGMLRLSDDIGTMADRILEMADRILVMASNIGVMADRIMVTQQLQNQKSCSFSRGCCRPSKML